MRRDKYLEQMVLDYTVSHGQIMDFESMCELSGIAPNIYLDHNWHFYYGELQDYQDRFEDICEGIDGELIETPDHVHKAAERGRFVLKILHHMLDYGTKYLRNLYKQDGTFIRKERMEKYTEQYLRKFVLYDKSENIGFFGTTEVYYDWSDELRKLVREALQRALAERIYYEVDNFYREVKEHETNPILFRSWAADRADWFYKNQPYNDMDVEIERPAPFIVKEQKHGEHHKIMMYPVTIEKGRDVLLRPAQLLCEFEDIRPFDMFANKSLHIFPSIPKYEPSQDEQRPPRCNGLTEEEQERVNESIAYLSEKNEERYKPKKTPWQKKAVQYIIFTTVCWGLFAFLDWLLSDFMNWCGMFLNWIPMMIIIAPVGVWLFFTVAWLFEKMGIRT